MRTHRARRKAVQTVACAAALTGIFWTATVAARPMRQPGTAGATAAPPPEARPPAVDVRAWLDRTAVWVADRVTYTVEVACKRGADILDDDLAPDKLKLDGLQLVGSETTRDIAAGDTTTHRFRYTLAAYRVDRSSLRIASVSVRYYVKRPGQRLEDAAPAGEVEVPGAVLAFRSVLPDDEPTHALRDFRPPVPRAAASAIAQPLGLGLVVASVVPAALGVIALVRRRRQPLVHRSARKVKQEERTSFESLRFIDLDSAGGRVEALTGIDALVRVHLRDVCGIDGPNLTPAEIARALATGDAQVPGEVVVSLLSACELARYAPPDKQPSIDVCREAFGQAERVLKAR